MTEAQRRQALDIMATMLAFDCKNIDCFDCPFANKSGNCLINFVVKQFRNLNKKEGEN